MASTPIPALTPLPPAPSRADAPDDFINKMNARLAAEPAFGNQLNAIAQAAKANADATAEDAQQTAEDRVATGEDRTAVAQAAAETAQNAAFAQAAVDQLAMVTATSVSEVALGTGVKVFEVQAGKQFADNVPVIVVSQADAAKYMAGTVVSYVGATLTVNVTDKAGVGSLAAWNISIAGIKGDQGDTGGVAITRSGRVANAALTVDERGVLIDITAGTFTQTFDPAAQLGNGWCVYIRNSGTGDITLDPNGAETIDGLTSFVMYPGEVRLVQCDGAAFRSVVLCSFARTFTTSGTFIRPPGYQAFDVEGIGGGGGGCVGQQGTNGGGGGKGGAGGGRAQRTILAGLVAATVAVTVGAGGTGSSSQVNATAGGNTTFGTLLTATGGNGAPLHIGGNGMTVGPKGGQDAAYPATDPIGGYSGGSIFTGHVSIFSGGQMGVFGSQTYGTGASIFGGGVGGSLYNDTSSYNYYPIAPGTSVHGGGGGGTGGMTSNQGGTSFNSGQTGAVSTFAGNGGRGGDLNAAGSDGVAPGGGGGGGGQGNPSVANKGGNGARGELRIRGVL